MVLAQSFGKGLYGWFRVKQLLSYGGWFWDKGAGAAGGWPASIALCVISGHLDVDSPFGLVWASSQYGSFRMLGLLMWWLRASARVF